MFKFFRRRSPKDPPRKAVGERESEEYQLKGAFLNKLGTGPVEVPDNWREIAREHARKRSRG